MLSLESVSIVPADVLAPLGARTSTGTVMTKFWSHIVHYRTSTWWVNSLWPSNAIRRQGTESILAQVMACCPTAPSHYLNQCWLIISKFQWHSSGGALSWEDLKISISKTRLKIPYLESHPGANELNDHVSTGGRFKNTLNFSVVNKIHIFQCMGKIFCVEFQRVPLKFHTKYLTHTLKDMIFIQPWNFKSS